MKRRVLSRMIVFALSLLCFTGCGQQEHIAAPEQAENLPIHLTGDPYPYDLNEYLDLRDYAGISYIPYGEINRTTIAYGDTVTAEIEGLVDGIEEPITGIDTFEVGNSNFLDGFDDALVGHDINDTIAMTLAFPEDYENPMYAGKNVDITAHILILDFSAYRDMNEAALWQIVVDESTVLRYPEAELERYTADFRSNYIAFAKQYNMSLNEYLLAFFHSSEDSLDDLCLQNAKDLIKEEMVMYSIFRNAGLQLTQADLDLCKPLWLMTYGYESETAMPVGWDDPGVAASLENMAIQRQVKSYICEQAIPSAP